jgi:hypothetical protein
VTEQNRDTLTSVNGGSRRVKYRVTTGLLYASLVISAAAGCILVFVPRIQSLFNAPKAWEITTSFVFVTLFGGLVALLYKRSEEERAQRASQRASLEEFYRYAVDAYHESKKIRRTLRAFSIRDTQPWQIERARYENLMDRLEDVQLKTERMVREITSRKYLFSDKQTDLIRESSNMENYLNNILKGYERSYAKRCAVAENGLINLDESLRVFVESGQPMRTKISKEYFKPAGRVRALIVDLIERLHL